MRHSMRLLLACLIGLGLVISVTAQTSEAQVSKMFEDGGWLIMLAGTPAVQKELGLDQQTREQIRELRPEFYAAWNKLGNCCGDSADMEEEQRQFEQALRRFQEIGRKMDAQVKRLLPAEDVARVQQIWWQFGDILRLPDMDALLKKIGVDQRQRKELLAVREQYDEHQRELSQEFRSLYIAYRKNAKREREDAQQDLEEALQPLKRKSEDLHRQAIKDMLDVLTAEQQQEYEEALGEPFEIPWGQIDPDLWNKNE